MILYSSGFWASQNDVPPLALEHDLLSCPLIGWAVFLLLVKTSRDLNEKSIKARKGRKRHKSLPTPHRDCSRLS
jgi:hypothetical protein